MSSEQNESRRARYRRPVVIGASAFVVAALVVGVVMVRALGPEYVDPADIKITPQPAQVAANAPVVAAPAGADASKVTDVTREYSSDLAGDIVDVRSRVQGRQRPAPAIVADDCLLAWAKKHLSALAATGTYEVTEVCHRPTAVLAGPTGADSKVLAYGVLEDTAPGGMKKILARSTSDRMAFAAVRSADGKAQLLAAAVLPNAK